MKKIVIGAILFLIIAGSGILYSSSKASFQVVDIMVCEEGIVLAELLAKAKVSRKDLYVVSYCKCEGMDSSMRSEVKGMPCNPPKNKVYSCICTGKSNY